MGSRRSRELGSALAHWASPAYRGPRCFPPGWRTGWPSMTRSLRRWRRRVEPSRRVFGCEHVVCDRLGAQVHFLLVPAVPEAVRCSETAQNALREPGSRRRGEGASCQSTGRGRRRVVASRHRAPVRGEPGIRPRLPPHRQDGAEISGRRAADQGGPARAPGTRGASSVRAEAQGLGEWDDWVHGRVDRLPVNSRCVVGSAWNRRSMACTIRERLRTWARGRATAWWGQRRARVRRTGGLPHGAGRWVPAGAQPARRACGAASRRLSGVERHGGNRRFRPRPRRRSAPMACGGPGQVRVSPGVRSIGRGLTT